MIKTIRSIGSETRFKKTKSKVSGDSMVGDGKVTNQKSSIKGKNQAKTAKSKNMVRPENYDYFFNSRNIGTGPGFFISGARLVFTK